MVVRGLKGRCNVNWIEFWYYADWILFWLLDFGAGWLAKTIKDNPDEWFDLKGW